MVCRKRTQDETTYFNEIKPQVEARIREKLDLWNEGISGSDFFIAAIGPALEIFGRYERVETYSGEEVKADELLEFVCRTVSEYALAKILKNSYLSAIDAASRFYLLWRWSYNSARIVFDEARKLASSCGVEKQMLQGFLYGRESYQKINGHNLNIQLQFGSIKKEGN